MERKEPQKQENKIEVWKKQNEGELQRLDRIYIPHPCIPTDERQLSLSALVETTVRHITSPQENRPHIIIISGAPNVGKTTLSQHIKELFTPLPQTIHSINWDQEELEIEGLLKSIRFNQKNTAAQKNFKSLIHWTNYIYQKYSFNDPLQLGKSLGNYHRDRNRPDAPEFLMATYANIIKKINTMLHSGEEQNRLVILDVPGATGIPLLPETTLSQSNMLETRPYANPICSHIRSTYGKEVFISSIGLGPGPLLYPIREKRYLQENTGEYGSKEQVEKARIQSWAIARHYRDKLPDAMQQFLHLLDEGKMTRPLELIIEKVQKNTSLKELAIQHIGKPIDELTREEKILATHRLWQMAWDLSAACLVAVNSRPADLKGVYLTNPI